MVMNNKELGIILTRVARSAIEEEFSTNKTLDVELKYNHPELLEKKGCFVTLTKNSDLRGCIGYITSDKPLIDTVKMAAKAAAFQDPRFPPLQEHELSNIRIEVSVLTTPKLLIANNEDDILRAFVPGETGIIIEKGFNSGLLLPQVFSKNTRAEEAFEMTCKKAGLNKDCWKDPETRIYLFRASIYNED